MKVHYLEVQFLFRLWGCCKNMEFCPSTAICQGCSRTLGYIGMPVLDGPLFGIVSGTHAPGARWHQPVLIGFFFILAGLKRILSIHRIAHFWQKVLPGLVDVVLAYPNKPFMNFENWGSTRFRSHGSSHVTQKHRIGTWEKRGSPCLQMCLPSCPSFHSHRS